jgi:hypothetical protein
VGLWVAWFSGNSDEDTRAAGSHEVPYCVDLLVMPILSMCCIQQNILGNWPLQEHANGLQASHAPSTWPQAKQKQAIRQASMSCRTLHVLLTP